MEPSGPVVMLTTFSRDRAVAGPEECEMTRDQVLASLLLSGLTFTFGFLALEVSLLSISHQRLYDLAEF